MTALPDQGWGVFSREVDQKTSMIALNLSLMPVAPLKEDPNLAIVSIPLRSSEGLPDTAESSELSPLETALQYAAEQAGARFVGRAWMSGRRELYFYAPKKFSIEKALARCKDPDHPFTSQQRPDPEWSYFLEELCPGPWEFQKLENNRLIAQLLEEGDDITRPREVEHYLCFPTRKARDEAIQSAESAQFKVTETSDDDEPPYPFGLQLIRTDAVTPQALTQSVGLLFRLAEQLEGEYEGWDCPDSTTDP